MEVGIYGAVLSHPHCSQRLCCVIVGDRVLGGNSCLLAEPPESPRPRGCVYARVPGGDPDVIPHLGPPLPSERTSTSLCTRIKTRNPEQCICNFQNRPGGTFFFFFWFKCLLQLLWLYRKLPLKLVCVKQPLARLTDYLGQECGRDMVNRALSLLHGDWAAGRT